jgi:hypothetical protein
MADITKCANMRCSNRDKCYRAMAKDSTWQSWHEFSFTTNKFGQFRCDHKINYKENKNESKDI